MRLITRGQWGAKHGDGKGEALLPATSVWLHHSVTVAPDLEWVDANGDRVDDDEAAAMRHIEAIGAQRFGTAYGFPYSLAAMPRGHALYEGHAIEQQGAHTYGYNHTGRGIVLVGNYEKHRPTDAQLDAVAWGLVEGKLRGWWKTARLSGGHRDVKATACPGKYAYAAIPEINRRAAALENKEDEVSAAEMWGHKVGGVEAGKRLLSADSRALRAQQNSARAVAEVRALAELAGVSLEELEDKADQNLATANKILVEVQEEPQS